ncbi:hypothetical protein ACH4HG_01705 [Streptomyces coeruleorubidus]|uniref:L,D-transpeptidase n=1 Tax=Streptomyces coeruleorubidus TaxID=116188 RepID=A0ABZ0KA44_STRC4|nr:MULTISPECIES: hypothetical protein [Streptomyces]WOT34843.1 hypothetical protein R5U08_12180 [Streptomyces coeruleorubidus]GGT85575.1 hypothetical protein GCM10010244_07650 [Streptomyces bellus]
MALSSSGIVAGLTAAALATVGYLAHQASQTLPAGLGRSQAGAAPAAGVSKAPPRARKDPAALPGDSGMGARVVYSLGGDRVWLVGEDETVTRTFGVHPSAVDPAPGNYLVMSRSNAITGSDGVPVEHVVRFTSVDGVVIGFSAAVTDPTTAPAPNVRTGGIRESREDGEAMWTFATIGRKVVVVR